MNLSKKLDKRVFECISEEVDKIWEYMEKDMYTFNTSDGHPVDLKHCVMDDWDVMQDDDDIDMVVIYFHPEYDEEWDDDSEEYETYLEDYSFNIYIPLINVLTKDWEDDVCEENICED